MSHNIKQTVLLIEQDPALRRLITLGLQHRSIQVIEATSPAHLPALDSNEQPPDLLLLDIDGCVNSDSSVLTTFQSRPHLSTLPIIVLAWENILPESGNAQHAAHAPITCVTKPFDARVLHATIERQLLERAVPQEASAALAAQEVLLLAQTARPAPSIWPIITAAALLLTFIGLLVHITVTLVGLLIFLIALMGWSLSKTPETPHIPSARLGI